MKEQSKKRDTGLSPDSRDTRVTQEGIRNQLDRVLSSPDFKASKKVKTIFRYLTDESLTGRGDHINARSVAHNAQTPPLDPDPPIDPIVRIQVNQLRRALKEYYAGPGKTDEDPRIDIPEDRLAPDFHSEKK